jgi:hypothetical protein
VSHYYYFAATLPNLELGAAPPLSSEEFLERCGRYMEGVELAAIRAALLSSTTGGAPAECAGASAFLDGYYAWERAFRGALALSRAARLGRAIARPADERPEGLSEAGTLCRAARAEEIDAQVRAVLLAADPLEGELAVERERWAAITSLLGYDSFDFTAVAAYRLRLQSLERLASFEAERGERGYRGVYDAILGAASAIDLSGDLR